MYARQITSEETYTLSEAKRIIKAEQSQKREVFFCKAKYFSLGLFALVIAILIPIIHEDAFISLIMIIASTYFFKEGKKI